MADPNTFVHLHVHSHYSLLNALGQVSDIAERVKALGMPAVALTDRGVLYGAVELFEDAKKNGIKPIIGMEAFVAAGKYTDRNPAVDSRPYQLVLLVQNEIGYRNLIRLSSIAHLQGFYYKPRVDKELLAAHHEGLIALSGGLSGEIPRAIVSGGRDEEVLALIRQYQQIFGAENFYLELQRHESDSNHESVNAVLIRLGREHRFPLVATNETYYLNPEDQEAHQLMLCIQNGQTLDSQQSLVYDGNYALRSSEEMIALFTDVPEAITNTLAIAERCTFELTLGQIQLPAFPLPEGETAMSCLRQDCAAGLRTRYPQPSEVVRQQLEYELSIIERMGFASYFLIVSDIVRFAKSHGILVGPGRGSAAGSIVAYSLAITDIDPVAYGLMFERFLNPDRISMPDIDLDFADDRRGEVIDYMIRKYGAESVAGIITFGTLAARAAVRDVGRVLGMGYSQVDQIAKLVPAPVQGRHIPLAKSIQDVQELKSLYESNSQVKRLIDLAIKIEGMARHASQHACGMVLSDKPLVEQLPLQRGQNDDVGQVTQLDMVAVEKIGLLKIDILGLSNLTIIQRALDIIKAVSGQEIDITKIPLDDKKTFALLARGETTGVFQLESEGMRRYIRELKPTRLEDITAMVSLYRPGPMQWIDSYIRRKHGKEEVSAIHPKAAEALRETYGIPVYQEQVMQIAKDLAGFTGGQADTLRKAMGKKIASLMAKMRKQFIDGAVANGVRQGDAEAIFRQLEDFAAYGFNKSHAVCYATIAYRTAYLKAHYPECFMAALMDADSKNIDRIAIEVEECRRLGLAVLPPDVNESFVGFGVVPGRKQIRFALGAIKNVGHGVVEGIVAERKANGPFQSLHDFLTRLGSRDLNRKMLESFIKCGALDSLGERSQLLANVEQLLKIGRHSQQERNRNQSNLFGDAPRTATLTLSAAAPNSPYEKLQWERELLGLYISGHPVAQERERLGHRVATIAASLAGNGNRLPMAGVIASIKRITTKNGEPMFFISLEDETGHAEAVVFPSVLALDPAVWQEGALVVVAGKRSRKDGTPKLIVDRGVSLEHFLASGMPDTPLRQSVRPSAHAPAAAPTSLTIAVGSPTLTPEQSRELAAALGRFPGGQRVYLKLPASAGGRLIQTDFRVQPTPELAQAVQQILKYATLQ